MEQSLEDLTGIILSLDTALQIAAKLEEQTSDPLTRAKLSATSGKIVDATKLVESLLSRRVTSLGTELKRLVLQMPNLNHITELDQNRLSEKYGSSKIFGTRSKTDS